MPKSFTKLVEDKKQVQFRVLEVNGKLIKRSYFGAKFSDEPINMDLELYEFIQGFEDVPH